MTTNSYKLYDSSSHNFLGNNSIYRLQCLRIFDPTSFTFSVLLRANRLANLRYRNHLATPLRMPLTGGYWWDGRYLIKYRKLLPYIGETLLSPKSGCNVGNIRLYYLKFYLQVVLTKLKWYLSAQKLYLTISKIQKIESHTFLNISIPFK